MSLALARKLKEARSSCGLARLLFGLGHRSRDPCFDVVGLVESIMKDALLFFHVQSNRPLGRS